MKYAPDKYDRVILRRWRTGNRAVIAVFPDEPGTASPYTCNSYEHVGQHGSCDWQLALAPATERLPARTVRQLPPDALALIAELSEIGYHPRLIQRMPRESLEIRRNKIAAMDAKA